MIPPRVPTFVRRIPAYAVAAGLLAACVPADPNPPARDVMIESTYDPTIPRRALGRVMGSRIRDLGVQAGDAVLVLYTSRQDDMATRDMERVMAAIREGIGNPEVRVVGRDLADRPGYSTLHHFDEPLTVDWIARQIGEVPRVRAVATFHGLPAGDLGRAQDWPPLFIHTFPWTDEAQVWLDAGRIRFAAVSRPRIQFDTVQAIPAGSWEEWFDRYYTAHGPASGNEGGEH